MPKTAKDLTPEELARYKESYRQRKIQQNLIINKKYEDAWKIAQEAAQVLYTIFQAKKVKVFGSLIDRSRFHQWSDIDLAVLDVGDGKGLEVRHLASSCARQVGYGKGHCATNTTWAVFRQGRVHRGSLETDAEIVAIDLCGRHIVLRREL